MRTLNKKPPCSICNRAHKTKADRVRSHDLKRERDLYRARAVDEVLAHHPGAVSRDVAELDVDLDVKTALEGLRP